MTNEEEGRAGTTAAPDTASDATEATTTTAADTGMTTATTGDTGTPAATTGDTGARTTGDTGTATAADTRTTAADTGTPAANTGTATEPAALAKPDPAALAKPDPAAPAMETRDTMPSSPPDGARVRRSLEAVKTAVVWLVVIQILTILSPLLPVSLKWALIVGVLLSVSSFAVGALAYLKTGRAQHDLPE